ncbi:alpha-galactosidase [Microbacterium lushaniae]|nr:alpha-galactosidase [Microbacterium lushaniae]
MAVGPRARVYGEGWQSWSPTTWYGAADEIHRPAERWQHLMRFRPGAAVPDDAVQGEGLLVVDPGDGAAVRTYGVTDASAEVPSIRARWRDGRVAVSATGPVASWTTPAGGADAGIDALRAFGDRIGRAAGARAAAAAPRVWCSWYRYFEDVTAADVRENLRDLRTHALPVDVVQIDDGWSRGTGEWTAEDERFGSVADAAAEIRDAGRRPGLWLAPFVVGAGSDVARWHPEWLTGAAGYNWGDDLVGLDLTHPGVRGYLTDVFARVREWGIGYVKLDFLYAGAVPGTRHDTDATPITAYRSGLELVREVLGEDAYVLGCGAPLLPSVGLVDAMRIASDTFHEGGEDGSHGLRGRMSLQARAWQDGRLWTTDPDCLVARPGFALREEWAAVVQAAPGVRGFSDRIAELDERGLQLVRDLLEGPAHA